MDNINAKLKLIKQLWIWTQTFGAEKKWHLSENKTSAQLHVRHNAKLNVYRSLSQIWENIKIKIILILN